MKDAKLYPGIIDSHFHASMLRKKGLNPHTVMDWCFGNGLEAALDIAVDTEDFEARKRFASGYPRIYLSAGLYPSVSEEKNLQGLLDTLERQAADPAVMVLGEAGLDYHWNFATPAKQQALFRFQAALASQLKKPLIVHSREAGEDTCACLAALKPAAGGIIHCFSEDYPAAKRYIDLGFLISFAGNVTYPKAENLHEAAAKIPLRALLLETDAPYMAPQPVRGKPNHPGMIGYTYEFIAKLRNLPLEELITGVRENFYRLLNLPE
ncbi:MAG: TatD family hydrolase [Spirochaetales bacterium]|nr:TatD family hydrolase [Spirochaetales bacterium]